MTAVRTEVAGSVWKVEVTVGQAVAAGDALVIVESMKMEIPVEAPAAGTVAEIRVAEGDRVAEGAVVVTLARAGAAG
jgi:biotin carboxyl carrier protein